MFAHPLPGQFLILGAWTAIIGVGIYADAATGQEQAVDLDVLRFHQLHQILHNRVHAVLVEVTVITEREEVKLQALALHHPLTGDVEDFYLSKVRLSRNGAQRRKLRTVELHPVVVVLMKVLEGFQHRRVIVSRKLYLLA